MALDIAGGNTDPYGAKPPDVIPDTPAAGAAEDIGAATGAAAGAAAATVLSTGDAINGESGAEGGAAGTPPAAEAPAANPRPKSAPREDNVGEGLTDDDKPPVDGKPVAPGNLPKPPNIDIGNPEAPPPPPGILGKEGKPPPPNDDRGLGVGRGPALSDQCGDEGPPSLGVPVGPSDHASAVGP
ncbi:MAG: hypothetical protein K2Z76_13190 [Mycobacterium gordonae]|nr:hypothetical protein [Mycobacterium gordonae]